MREHKIRVTGAFLLEKNTIENNNFKVKRKMTIALE